MLCAPAPASAAPPPEPESLPPGGPPDAPHPMASSLAEAFALVPDSRSRRGTTYPLPSILLLCLVAILHGCPNPERIHAFGRLRPPLLARLGFRPAARARGKIRPRLGVTCPNEDTIAGALRRVDSGALNEALAGWVARMMPEEASAAVDGKALRGAEEHVLEVLVNDVRLVAWQAPVGKKENELSALEGCIGGVLAKFPQIKLLTGDAMFCQKSIAAAVSQARRHYFLQLKSPHKTDVATARRAFCQLASGPALAQSEEKRGAPAGPSS